MLRPHFASPQMRGCPSERLPGHCCTPFSLACLGLGAGTGGWICWELGLEVGRELGPWSQEGPLRRLWPVA